MEHPSEATLEVSPACQPGVRKRRKKGSVRVTARCQIGFKIRARSKLQTIVLLKVDYPEQAVRIFVGSRGKKQLIGIAVLSAALSESQRPQATKGDDLMLCILELRHEFSGFGIEHIDAAIAHVPHQQPIARRTKILRRQRDPPGSLQVGVLGKALDEFAAGAEDIHRTLAETGVGEGYIQLVVDVLNAIYNQA